MRKLFVKTHNVKRFIGLMNNLTTYCLLYDYKKAILLYPKYDKDFNLEYTLNTNDAKQNIERKTNNDKQNFEIKFCTLDLKSIDLKAEEPKIIKRICEIIEFEKNEKTGAKE